MRVWLALVLVIVTLAGCVKQVCFGDSECPSGKVCSDTGQCVTPQCTADTQCGEKQVCEKHQCVEGCIDAGQCPDGFMCSSRRCVAVAQGCDCPAVPDLCLEDINPSSSLSGKSLCLREMDGAPLVMFFGSVACPTCHVVFSHLADIHESLLSQGTDSQLVFVNLKSVALGPAAVGSMMPDVSEPVLQDTEESDLWDALGADWYEIVIVDKNGCLAWHSGPLAGTISDADVRDGIRAQWQAAAEAQCNSGRDVVTEIPDVTGDETAETEDVGVDAPEDQNPGDLPEIPDALPDQDWNPGDDQWGPDIEELHTDVSGPDLIDLVDDGGSEDLVDSGGDSTPDFELKETCQIETGSLVSPGQKVPHFLCMDRNPNSPTFQQGYSETQLLGKVWVGYTGGCT